MKLNDFFFCGKQSVLDKFDAGFFNVRNIMKHGKGIICELTAKHILLNDFSPQLLTVLDFNENFEDDQFKKYSESDHAISEFKKTLSDYHNKAAFCK
jgi:hypothetical protein